jgi:hypothetical protein
MSLLQSPSLILFGWEDNLNEKVILSVVLYGHRLREEHRMPVLENGVLSI